MKRRIWGLPVVLQWSCAEQLAIAAEPVPPPRVVIVYVQAPYPGVGGVGANSNVVQGIVQHAITEGTGERL